MKRKKKNRISNTTLVLFLVVWLAIPSAFAKDEKQPDHKAKNKRILSLAESIVKSQEGFKRGESLRGYWKRTLEDIQNSTYTENNTHITSKWKSLLRDSPRRFFLDGFPSSWDGVLQQWSEDVAEYLESAGGEYPMSTYGRPSTLKKDETEVENKTETLVAVEEKPKSKKKTSTTPITKTTIPSPAQSHQEVLPHTDLADKTKKIWIVTTAALPWMTGTAVNPLLRAAHLTKGRGPDKVTLMLPWLEKLSDQERVYNKVFQTPAQQEAYIRNWLAETAGLPQPSRDLRIAWYTAWQQRAENSLYSMGDITALIPQEEVDICILEEPEHLNWYRAPGESWTFKFPHVVGIIHTNYFCYAQEQPAALIRAPAMKLLCSWMCRAHCHRVIKLSGTLNNFCPEKELVENVHGVRQTFLDMGQDVGGSIKQHDKNIFNPNATPTVYFIGKMLWSKGLGSLMELLRYAEKSAGLKVKVDMYGGGPDLEAARTRATNMGLEMPFYGPIDHAELAWTHKVFINPSTSEVLCTTVAEALAMGKFVVLPSHPSNDFFAQFPNCLPYSTKEEFVGNLYYALTHAPEPLTEEYAHALSWDAATERLEAAGCITADEAEAKASTESEAGVEINLPPLIEDEEARKVVSITFRRSRALYRQFRSRLSREIQQSNVLPKELQKRLVRELDKRLDIDIDRILNSPTLRLQLSPAELDKVLLEFYDQVAAGQRGDLLRVISGGTDVGRQDLYLKQQAARRRRRREELAANGDDEQEIDGEHLSLSVDADDFDPLESIATQLVKRALKRNLPRRPGGFSLVQSKDRETSLRSKQQKKSDRKTPKMTFQPQHRPREWTTPVRVPLGLKPHPLVRSSWTPPLVPLI